MPGPAQRLAAGGAGFPGAPFSGGPTPGAPPPGSWRHPRRQARAWRGRATGPDVRRGRGWALSCLGSRGRGGRGRADGDGGSGRLAVVTHFPLCAYVAGGQEAEGTTSSPLRRLSCPTLDRSSELTRPAPIGEAWPERSCPAHRMTTTNHPFPHHRATREGSDPILQLEN